MNRGRFNEDASSSLGTMKEYQLGFEIEGFEIVSEKNIIWIEDNVVPYFEEPVEIDEDRGGHS